MKKETLKSTASTPITVCIVDDHHVVREGTQKLLEAHPNIRVIASIDSGETLMNVIHTQKPHVILLDINLPDQNGLTLLAEIRAQEINQKIPPQIIILFTAHTDRQYIRRGITLKANGYVSKTVSQTFLQDAIFEVLRTQTPVYSPDIARKVQQLAEPTEPLSELTLREQEILLQVAQGLTNRDIATALVVSVKTVDTHVANLMKKLNLSNRAQLTAYTYQKGLL